VRPLQPVRAAVALPDAGRHQARVEGEERDLVGNRVPEEKPSASLGELSDSDAEGRARVAR